MASDVDSSVIRNAWGSVDMILYQPQSVDEASFTPIDEDIDTDTFIDLMCQKDCEGTRSDNAEERPQDEFPIPSTSECLK